MCYCGGHGGDVGSTAVIVRATAVMTVPRRPHCGLAQPANVLNMFKVSAVPPRTSTVLTVFGGATAINDGTRTQNSEQFI